jgi:hypothetical protein
MTMIREDRVRHNQFRPERAVSSRSERNHRIKQADQDYRLMLGVVYSGLMPSVFGGSLECSQGMLSMPDFNSLEGKSNQGKLDNGIQVVLDLFLASLSNPIHSLVIMRRNPFVACNSDTWPHLCRCAGIVQPSQSGCPSSKYALKSCQMGFSEHCGS